MISRAPNTVIVVCATVIVVVVFGIIGALVYAGRDPMDLTRLVNTLLNAAGFLTGTGAFLYAGMAAKSSGVNQDHLENGTMDKKIAEAMEKYWGNRASAIAKAVVSEQELRKRGTKPNG